MMKREDFTFDSRDGITKLHAVRWTPDDTEPVGVVQIIHGMCEHVGRYEDFAKFLVDKGFVVTAEDHLGHGKSIVDDKKGYFCRQDPATVVVRDVHRLKKITQELYPGKPYYIIGHSMGSFILRNYLFKYGKGIDGAVVMGTGMPSRASSVFLKILASTGCLFGHAARPSKFISVIAFGSYNKRIQNARTPYDWLTKVDEIVDIYLKDPLCGFMFPCNGFKTMAELLLRLHKKSNIDKIPVTLRVLVTSGSEDPVGSYGAGPQAVYKEFVAAGMQKVDIKMYEGDRHEILNETDNRVVYEDIYNWLTKEQS